MAKQPNIGKLVRTLRQELNLSQEKFAAEFGVTFATINRWENKRATPSPLAMQRISTLLNRLLAEVGKRVRGKGERANKNPFPFNLFPFPPLAKVTFARGLMSWAIEVKFSKPHTLEKKSRLVLWC
ncbi:MAG: helix-turn-helix transcriptional regulator [Nostoc sp. ChiQUE01a]|nr:helix-turn-helix transcriptional regulator [Nostoc sp. ChiQUE01a]